MENTFKKTVIFNGDLKIKYDPNLIDLMQVYNLSENKFTKCEHWGWNDEGENDQPFYDFGMIADFDFTISKTNTILFHGDTPEYGYFNSKPRDLVLLPVAAKTPENFTHIGSFNCEQITSVPKTMWELAQAIDSFIFLREAKFKVLKIKHKEKGNKMATKLKINTGLPF